MYALPVRKQMKVVFQRIVRDYWRNVSYNFARLVVLTGLSFLFGVMYFDTKLRTLGAVQSLLGGVNIAMLFGAAIHLMTALTPLFTQRAVYYREQAARSYSPWLYAGSYGSACLWLFCWRCLAFVVVVVVVVAVVVVVC